MAFSKKTIYILLLFATGLLYFLYSFSNTIDTNFYKFAPHFKPENVSHLPAAPASSLKYSENENESPIPDAIKLNTSSSVSVISKNIQMPANDSLLKPNVDKPEAEKKSSVIQKILAKSDNKSSDSIVQGVLTQTLYDSGFVLPSVEICPDFGRNLQVAVIVTSAPKHDTARMAIRQTWGHFQQRSDIAIAFLIGKTPDADLPTIRKEAALYGDVIQANIMDSYNNLTLKTISMLEWIDNYCHGVKFVLKTDDDMFINVPRLLSFLSKHVKDKRKIYGRLAKKWKPIRNRASKYFVSPQQYKNPIFPDFTTGPAYALTSDIVHDLYETALTKTYLKLEDVYTTGIVAQERKIQRIHINEFFNRRVSLSACNIQKGISIHMIKFFEQYDLWKKLLDGRSKC